jgi:tRNA-specific 2-thiouridylase
MSDHRIIAVAMSGGVDSSVAAAKLIEEGANVIGLMMRLWSYRDHLNRCCSPDDMDIARQIASQLDIPFYALDAQDIFKEHVVDYFVEGYSRGITPNPCIECNRHVRWNFLLRQAHGLGATHLATGHYARIRFSQDRYHLLRAKDNQKDQSYVLCLLDQSKLEHSIFPLGEMTKPEVRDYARSISLPVAEREESQDLCFVGDGDYLNFLLDHHTPMPAPGPIFDVSGNQIGNHKGLAAYTIGQRKGIGISKPYPLYVIKKDIEKNALIVGSKDQLGINTFIVDHVNWIDGSGPDHTIHVQVQVRYKAQEMGAEVAPITQDKVRVHLERPLPDVTPGQFAVFYVGQECLGGGKILP